MNQEKVVSLQWAIDELSKQKEKLAHKLSVAQKRDDTNSLIAEVNAQKKALEERISSLADGFNASSELVDEPINSIEEELNLVNDKLEIAKDRLNTLEQEEYLEVLGRKLNGDFKSDTEQDITDLDLAVTDPSEIPDSSSLISSNVENELESDPVSMLKSSTVPKPTLMKSPSNRIKETTTNVDIQTESSSQEDLAKSIKLKDCEPAVLQSIEDCALTLGVTSEFLINHGMQAVLRMIARNGNKLSLPLELDQVD